MHESSGVATSDEGARAREIELTRMIITVMMEEYRALRAEILQVQRRVSSLITYSVGFSVTLVSSAALTVYKAHPAIFEVILLLTVLLLCLIMGTCVGLQNSIFEMGRYLRGVAEGVREVLEPVQTGHVVMPGHFLSWEKHEADIQSQRHRWSRLAGRGGSVLEAALLAVLAAALLALAGWLYLTGASTRGPLAPVLFVIDLIAALAVVGWGGAVVHLSKRAFSDNTAFKQSTAKGATTENPCGTKPSGTCTI
ncbi:MAG: hypothetical protein ACYCYK_13660 [Candidatus Dormibacteria bacterium]